MKCNRKELVAAFDAVAPGLANRDVLANAQAFVFYDGRLYTYNDKTAVSIGMPEGWDFEGAVKASEFHRVLRKMDADEVSIEAAGSLLTCTCGRARMEVKTEAEFQKYHETMGIPEKWATLPEKAMEAIRRAAMCAGRSLSRPLLMFVHVKGDMVRSTDNHRLLVNTVKGGKMPEFLVPAGCVTDLSAYGCNQVGRTEGWLHFKAPSGVVYSTRTMDPKGYPDFSALLDVDGEELSFPKELLSGLAKAVEVLDPKEVQPVVEITINNNVLQLGAEGPYANFKERYRVEFEGGTAFRVAPGLLADALKLAVVATVGEKRIRMANETAGFVHVVGLMAKTEAAAVDTKTAKPKKEAAPKAARKGKPSEPPPEQAPEDDGGDAW